MTTAWGFTIRVVGHGDTADEAWLDVMGYIGKHLSEMDSDDAEPERLG